MYKSTFPHLSIVGSEHVTKGRNFVGCHERKYSLSDLSLGVVLFERSKIDTEIVAFQQFIATRDPGIAQG